MTLRHTITRYGTGRPSKPSSIAVVLGRQAKIMEQAGRWRSFHLRRRGKDTYGPGRSFAETQSFTRDLLAGSKPAHTLYTLGVDMGRDVGIKAIAKVGTVDVGYPVADTPGVHAIDAIYGAVHSEFGQRFGITNLGICVNKPGEHGKCNAVDIGVFKPRTADAIHEAILTIGNFLRARMLADMAGEAGGLPVNGVIVMEQVCSRENTSWHYYSGTAHVSHVHVSGWPNLVPGWV